MTNNVSIEQVIKDQMLLIGAVKVMQQALFRLPHKRRNEKHLRKFAEQFLNFNAIFEANHQAILSTQPGKIPPQYHEEAESTLILLRKMESLFHAKLKEDGTKEKAEQENLQKNENLLVEKIEKLNAELLQLKESKSHAPPTMTSTPRPAHQQSSAKASGTLSLLLKKVDEMATEMMRMKTEAEATKQPEASSEGGELEKGLRAALATIAGGGQPPSDPTKRTCKLKPIDPGMFNGDISKYVQGSFLCNLRQCVDHGR